MIKHRLKPLSLLLILVLLAGGAPRPAAAQGSQPQQDIESLALAVHVQNWRTHSYTYWIGGNLGDPANQLQVVPPLGEVFDDWTLDELNGDPAASAPDRARPVLLNFWASWCPPCRLEFPHLVDVALAPQDHAFDVLFANTSDYPGDSLAFLSMQPGEIHTVLDTDDRLWMRLNGQSLPTSYLLDADGTLLAAHVGMMTPTVVAFFDGVAANPGVGTFVAADHPVEPPGADLAPIAPGDVIPAGYGAEQSGAITNDHPQDVYSFEGQAGDWITIRAVGYDDLDTYLVLMTADGERLDENDDDGQSTNSIIQRELPAAGTYWVVVTRFLEAEGFGSGRYAVTITSSAAVPALSPPGGSLSYGDTVTGTLDDMHYEDRWTFEGQSGDVISVVMETDSEDAGGLDGYLLLEGPDGARLAEVDDGLASVMPMLEAFSLPADGTYTLVATRFGFANGGSAGPYTLTLQGGSGTVPPPSGGAGVQWFTPDNPPPGLRPILYNHWVHGVLDDANQDDWFVFRGQTGDQLAIRMAADSGDLDSFLLLTDAGGYEIGRSDDVSVGVSDAALDGFALPADGTYFIRATRYGFANGPSSGAYSLIIETDAEALPLSGDESQIPLSYGVPAGGSLSADNMGDPYTFQGTGGSTITISVRGAGIDTALSLRGPDGDELVYRSGWIAPGEVRLQDFVLPLDGSYAVDVLLEDLNTSGDYQILLLGTSPAAIETAVIPAAGLDLEIVLTWEAPVDLDLAVTDPAGTAAERDRSADDFCTQAEPVPAERFIWAEGTALPGFYEITVIYQFNCGGLLDPVPFTLTLIRDGIVSRVVSGTLAGAGDRYTVLIDYAGEG